jgi:prevent-host-death family protein
MATVDVQGAETQFSRLLDQVAAGEEFIIAKAGKPVARLSPLGDSHKPLVRVLGLLSGRAVIPVDFDTPLPDDVLAAFEGG